MRNRLLNFLLTSLIVAPVFSVSAANAAVTCSLTATPQPAHLTDTVTLTIAPVGTIQSAFINQTRVSAPVGTLTVTPTALGSYTAHGMVLSDLHEFFCDTTYQIVAEDPVTLVGDVTNALTGLPLPGVALALSGGMTATSDATGAFTFNNAPLGNYTLTASLTGFTTETASGTAVRGVNPPIHIVMNPVLPEGQLRIVLTWGESPSDLDTHLFTTWADGQKYHLFYQALSGLNTRLDVDDTSSYGPETTTILDKTAGRYSYAVNDYTHRNGHGAISSSEAVVKVYQGNNLINEFQPTNRGEEVSWHVFDAVISAAGVVRIIPVDAYSSTDLDGVDAFP